MSLHTHDTLPMFAVENRLDGASFVYRDIWQRKNLVLVSLAPMDSTGERYVGELLARAGDLRSDDVQLVVTADSVPGIPSPGVVVADKWGEIHLIAGAGRALELPTAEDLVEWTRFVRMRCPECEGEWR
jgi:hypothetical protein